MGDTPDQKCSDCGKTASLKCSRCKKVFYCDAACQKAQWKNHKKICQESDLDRTIHRAADLLQQIFYVYRERLFDEAIESIENRGDTLMLRDYPHKPGTLIPFPHNLVHDDNEKKMVLSTMVCNEPIAYLHDILVQLLKGTNTEIQELSVKVKKPARRTRVIAVRGEMTGEWRTHAVIKVATADGSRAWIIDLSGAQYGMFASCLDEKTYYDRYVEKLLNVTKPGTNKAGFKKVATMQGNLSILARIGWDGVAKLEEVIKPWEVTTELTLPKLLRQPEDAFMANKKELLNNLDAALEAFVKEADYTADILATEKFEMLFPGFAQMTASKALDEISSARTVYRA